MKNNFKWIFCVLIFAVIMPLCTVMFFAGGKTGVLNIDVQADDSSIVSVQADYSNYTINSEDDAYEMLDDMKTTFGFSRARDVLVFESRSKIASGYIYRFVQYQDGLRVYATHLDISVSSQGKVLSMTGKYYFNMGVDDDASYGIDQVKTDLVKLYGGEAELSEEVYYFDRDVAYKVYIINVISNPSRNVFVSARTGVIIKNEVTSSAVRDSLPSTRNYNVENVGVVETNLYNQSVTLNVDKYTPKSGGQPIYILGNAERRIYVVDGQNKDTGDFKYIDSTDGTFTDQTAVQAYEYLMKCYDYYLEGSFGESIEGMYNYVNKRITLIGIVHYDYQYQNAAFVMPFEKSLTAYFYFGDGGGITTHYARALDIVGHEYQHSINNAKAGLSGVGQEGAINEAISDIFGAIIEGKDIDSSVNFWRIGEDIYTYSGYIRDMSNPSSLGDVSHYSQLRLLRSDKEANEDNDNGYVHANCTLLTYATYLMYKSCPEFFTPEKISQLWYATLCHLKEQETFISCSNYLYQAARDLGWEENRVQDVYKALSNVGIPGFEGVKIWGDCTLTTFEGIGTSLSPYIIKSTDEFASMMYYVNDQDSNVSYLMASYQLDANITLPSNVAWEGIGTQQRPFNGSFNGSGHTISGLNLNNEQQIYNGLFVYVGANGYISDLEIFADTSSSAEYTGGIAGRLEGGLSGCGSNITLSGKNVGGLAGLVINKYGGQILSSCYFSGSLTGDVVGGLVAQFATEKDEDRGLHMAGYISSCYSAGTLTGSIVGGLVGKANALIFVNDINTAKIVGKNGAQALGGFVGQLYFLNPLASRDTATEKVTNYFISCLSTAEFENVGGALTGTVFAQDLGDPSMGFIYIEKVTVKKRDIDYTSNGLDGYNVKVNDLRTSTDNMFEGDFDFDNAAFYKDDSVFTFFVGNDAFNTGVDFVVIESSMPSFSNLSTWFSFVAGIFAGGQGTAQNPYKISTAEQLATLSYLVSQQFSSYSVAHYQLTNDIDLKGRVWPGIGSTTTTYIDGAPFETKISPFAGTFDGAGHTIRNMTSLSLYSGQNQSSNGQNYTITSYSAGLFGITASVDGYVPTIKNLTIESPSVRGSRAGAVVSVAYGAINLENVAVSGGSVFSNYIAGGLISTMYGMGGVDGLTSSIMGCSVNTSVSGVVAGGAVGYATNQQSGSGSVDIENLLVQGKVLVNGYPLEEEGEYLDYTYRRAIGGGVFGILLVQQTNIINSIILADIVAYSREAYIGGFVGEVGAKDSYSGSQININILGGKLAGKAYYIFDEAYLSSGAILGTNNLLSLANISLVVDEKTFINSTNSYVQNNQMNAVVTTECNPTVSQDEVGAEGGDFDIYSDSYFADDKYFDTEKAWSSEQTGRLYFTITFLDRDGRIFKTCRLKVGEKLDASEIPSFSDYSTVDMDNKFYGWSYQVENAHSSMTVTPVFVSTLRTYQVEYWANGKKVTEKDVSYGSSIPQDVEAVKKEGNFFVKYTFKRWGEEGLKVGGNMKVEAIYQTRLATGSIVLIIIAAGIAVAAGGYFFLKRK